MSSEIDILRQKKALELRRKMLLSQERKEQEQPEPPPKINSREIIRKILAGRGLEVLETARRYYPSEINQIEDTLAGMVNSGKLKGPISGEELYSFLRRLGLVFSMDVKIRVKERGELKTLEQKFREGVH